MFGFSFCIAINISMVYIDACSLFILCTFYFYLNVLNLLNPQLSLSYYQVK